MGNRESQPYLFYFIALHNLLENNEIQSRSESLSEQIRDTYLIDKYAQEGKNIKFEPVKEDNEAY